MVQQKPVSLYKIIFTITCKGETLYDAQKLAMNITAALEDGYKVVQDGVSVDMTTEKTVVLLDNDCADTVITLPNIQISATDRPDAHITI